MLDARRRPVGDDDEHLSAAPRGASKRFRKAQVVTNQRRDPLLIPMKSRQFVAGAVVLLLLARRIGMELAVP